MASYLRPRFIGPVTLMCWSALCAAQPAPPGDVALSEKDYFSDMPIVLSVSRLPQRLDETPGAVTIIDRDMIRLSGARDVADLLRLVPGFQSSHSFERSAPQASYHGGFSSFSNRMQVLVDGRSVYSPYFIGSTEFGLQAVAMQDIERIEVLRGSNSAAYGARAFLGVVNIITRDPMDTMGVQANVAAGQNEVADARAGIGWGSHGASYRLGVDRRSDGGLLGAGGRNQVSRVNFRADLQRGMDDEIQLRAGALQVGGGKGSASNVDDPWRDTTYRSEYVQFDWRSNLSENSDLALNFSHMHESYQDAFAYSLIPLGINGSIEASASGRALNDSLLAQHTVRHNAALRTVWGGELRREAITSRPLYNTDAALVNEFFRLFGNAEWRLTPQWLINAGAMVEKSSVTGVNLAPRLMLNWHLADGQTMRAGVSRAYRPPSAFEKFADVRYVWNGNLLAITNLSSGSADSEKALVQEIGYLGEFPALALNLDVRVFHEGINGFIRRQNYSPLKDYENSENLAIQGLEYQLKWRPWQGAKLVVSQAFTDVNTKDIATVHGAPRRASTIMFTQGLPGGLDLSLIHQEHSLQTLQGSGETPNTPTRRTDVRLAMPLQLDRQRGELALVLQNIGSPYQDFQPNFVFERRAFVTLSLNN